jgi:hypothetical protein
MRGAPDATRRGAILSVTVTVCALALVAVAELSGGPLKIIAPVAALVVAAAASYRHIFAWRSLVSLIVLVILFIPIKRYTMAGGLPFQLEPYRIIVALVLACWLTSLLIDPSVRIRRSPIDLPLLMYVIVIFLSLLVNVHRVGNVSQDVFKTLVFFMSFVLLYFVIVSVLKTPRDIDRVVASLAGGGAVLSVLAVIESRTHYNFFDHLSTYAPFLHFQGGTVLNRGGRLRVVGSAQHPIAFGAALVMLVPLAVYRAQVSTRRRWWVAVFLLILGSLSTSSRTAVTMLLTVALIYLVMRPRQMKRIWPALLPALVVIHFAIPGTIGTTVSAFFPSGGLVAQQQDAGAGHARLSTVSPVLHGEVAPDPILGEGFGTRITVPTPTTPVANAPITDDQWLGSLAETGIAGVFVLGWLFVRFFRSARRAAMTDTSPRGALLTAATATVTSYSVGMLTFDAYSFIQVTFIFFIVLALGAATLNTSPDAWRRSSLLPTVGREPQRV